MPYLTMTKVIAAAEIISIARQELSPSAFFHNQKLSGIRGKR
jgi:hypothetical protein